MDVALLRRHTRTQGMDRHGHLVDWFFDVLKGLPPSRQSRVLRFIWARDRLPPNDAGFAMPFTIMRDGRDSPDGALPSAHTCTFQLDLPTYSSPAVMRRQLLAAADNCVGYDLDGGAQGVEDGADDDDQDEDEEEEIEEVVEEQPERDGAEGGRDEAPDDDRSQASDDAQGDEDDRNDDNANEPAGGGSSD